MTAGAGDPTEIAGGYRIREARRDDLSAIENIERAAAEVFSEADLPPPLREESTPRIDLEAAGREHRLLVVTTSEGEAVGFALLVLLGGHAHLAELDVHPDHGRRGLGVALVLASASNARAEGHDVLTLTTFSHLPWNAPFYQRMGFDIIESVDLEPPLRAQLDEEAALGLDPKRRVAMRLALRA